MSLPAEIMNDIEIILCDYELRDNSLTQFYIGSTRENFRELMEEIGRHAHISEERWIVHTLSRTTKGGL